MSAHHFNDFILLHSSFLLFSTLLAHCPSTGPLIKNKTTLAYSLWNYFILFCQVCFNSSSANTSHTALTLTFAKPLGFRYKPYQYQSPPIGFFLLSTHSIPSSSTGPIPSPELWSLSQHPWAFYQHLWSTFPTLLKIGGGSTASTHIPFPAG